MRLHVRSKLVGVGFAASMSLVFAGSLQANTNLKLKNQRCYEISATQTDRHIDEEFAERHFDTWCYLNFSQGDDSFRFVYMADGKNAHPETSALVHLEEDGSIDYFIHASRLQGNVSIQKSFVPNFSPFSVPLEESKLAFDDVHDTFVQPLANIPENFEAILSDFTRPNAVEKVNRIERLTEGHSEGALDASHTPWDGDFWNFSGTPLAAGKYSPLGKYDEMETARTGTNPNASGWEQTNHSSGSAAWGGHCNGWAASSVLFPEPNKFLWNQQTQTLIKPSDIKGMLSESSFCVDWAFYGKRNNGRPGDDPKDIYPDLFHQVILYYIDNVKKPIAMDYFPDAWVDNNVVTGYKMDIKKDATNPKLFNVTTVLQMYRYASRDHVGTAAPYDRTFTYTLETDDQGNVIKGTWVSTNPDFLWVPLKPKQCGGGSENPGLSDASINHYMNDLPEAKEVTKDLNLQIHAGELDKDQSADIVANLKGYNSTLTFTGAKALKGMRLDVSAYPENPSGAAAPQTFSINIDEDADVVDKAFHGMFEIVKITLVNTSGEKRDLTQVVLKSHKFLGGN